MRTAFTCCVRARSSSRSSSRHLSARGSLVLDLGAGPGTLTSRLAGTGARILAIERDPRFVAKLHRRFADQPNVRVIEGDLRTLPLPRRPFQVVASIPYSLSTMLLRRLLQPARPSLHAADLVVEWGFAKRITAARARDVESAWWGARFEFAVVRRIPRSAFTPPPAVESAHLTIRRRPGLASQQDLRALHAVLSAGYRYPRRTLRAVLADVVPRRRISRLAAAVDLAPTISAGAITVEEWAALARHVRTAVAAPLPSLPRHLDTG
jgi:23S rRNA (adenine-N6)-dimethyltransferase